MSITCASSWTPGLPSLPIESLKELTRPTCRHCAAPGAAVAAVMLPLLVVALVMADSVLSRKTMVDDVYRTNCFAIGRLRETWTNGFPVQLRDLNMNHLGPGHTWRCLSCERFASVILRTILPMNNVTERWCCLPHDNKQIDCLGNMLSYEQLSTLLAIDFSCSIC